jgi:stage V sporulation protein B
MKHKSLFFKSTLYLVIGGFLTRLLGFIIKIIYTRIVGPEGISLLSIVTPTYSMLLTITSLALPITLSKLIAENKKRSIKLMSNALFIVLILNVIMIIMMFLLSDVIAKQLLNEPMATGLLKAMSLTLPFVSISSIVKGYFNGKFRTLPYMISNILEQTFRLIVIVLLLPKINGYGYYFSVEGIILLSIFSETFSVIVFSFFMPKHVLIKKDDLKFDIQTEKEILNISVPSVSGKIIGNIGYFLEPIILTNLLYLNGYSHEYIISSYGAYNAYSISILTIPAFLIMALSNTIVPEVSKYTEERNNIMVKKRVKQSLMFTFFLGILFSILIIIFRNQLLMILYNTNLGSDFIKVLAPFFCLFYLESIFYSILQGAGYAKIAMKITTIGVFIKIISLILLCFCHLGMYALVYSEIINIIYITYKNIITLRKNNLI